MRKRNVFLAIAALAAIPIGLLTYAQPPAKPEKRPEKLSYAKIKHNLPVQPGQPLVRDRLVVADFDAEFKAFTVGKYQWRIYVFKMLHANQKMAEQELVGSHEFPAFEMKRGQIKTDRMVWGLHAGPGLYRVCVELHQLARVVDHKTRNLISDTSRYSHKEYLVRIRGVP